MKIGHILDTTKENKFIMTEYIGKGSGVHNDNKINFEMLLSMSGAPVIKYNQKYYSLTWSDIVELAEKSGLFDEA